MEKKEKESEKMDLLTAMEQIVALSENSQLSAELYDVAEEYIEYVSQKLGLTKIQSVMMSLFVNKYTDVYTSSDDLCQHLSCRPITILRLSPEIEELEKRELICCRRESNRTSYRVPCEVITAFTNNENYIPRKPYNLSFKEFFNELNIVFFKLKNNELTYTNGVAKIQDLMSHNEHLHFVKEVESLNYNEQDMMILLAFANLYINNEDNTIFFNNIAMAFEDEDAEELLSEAFDSEEHILFKQNIIERTGGNSLFDYEFYRLTRAAKSRLFPEMKIKCEENGESDEDTISNKELLMPDKIAARKLYYNDSTEQQIVTLTQLLNEENYNKICTRLKEGGMRSGFTCMFYGVPGTGKTESVMQLARTTGRGIMQVDMSSIKGAYVGESEKNIKAVFDNYRKVMSDCTPTPILLFNEADGIIGKRMESTKSSVDKMENTIQNIILQEIENFDGILIATTNLTQNIDKAFERRFLYKVEFKKPSIEARKSIWKEKIPTLDDESIELLAHKYDFSGGQIENIARHYTIDNILYENCNNFNRLMEHCDNEIGYNTGMRRLGF